MGSEMSDIEELEKPAKTPSEATGPRVNPDVAAQSIPDTAPSEPKITPASAVQAIQPIQKKEASMGIWKVAAGGALMFSLLSLGGAGWLFYQQNQQQLQQMDVLKDKSALEMKLHTQQQLIEALQSHVAKSSSTLDALNATSGSFEGRIGYMEQQLSEMTGTQRVDWMLKEAEHFVMVAERRLSLLGDVDGGLALLNEADKLVRDMGEPTTRPLREAIAKDLASLKLAESDSVDVDGVFIKLNLLTQQISDLDRVAMKYSLQTAAEPDANAQPESGLDYFLGRAKALAGSLVTVQKLDDNKIKPLLMADQQAYLEQTLQVLLEQAQLALLRGDSSTFAVSLKEVSNRIGQFMRTDTKAAGLVLAELKTLEQMNIKPAIPSIEKSVRAVQVFRDFWQNEKLERQATQAAIMQQKAALAPVGQPVFQPNVQPAQQPTVQKPIGQ